MLAADLLWFVIRWGVIGSAAVTAYLVIAWQAGLVSTVRDESGALRRAPMAGVLTGIGSVLMFIVLLVLADVRELVGPGVDLPFARLYALNYLVCIFWLLYDTIVIDILIVVVWHPPFLRLPDREAHGSPAYHLRTIPRGMILAAIITGVATSIIWLFFR